MQEATERTTGLARLGVTAMVVLLLIAGCADPTSSDEYTSLETDYASLQSDYAALQEQLGTLQGRATEMESQIVDTESELAAASEALSDREGELAELKGELADVTSGVSTADSHLSRAYAALAALADGELWFLGNPQDAERYGMTVGVADDLVTSLDPTAAGWDELNDQLNGAGCRWCDQVDELDDAELSAALDRWWGTTMGTGKEYYAWLEVQMRILQIVIDEMAAAQDFTVDYGPSTS
jgi:hypothetical protein